MNILDENNMSMEEHTMSNHDPLREQIDEANTVLGHNMLDDRLNLTNEIYLQQQIEYLRR